MSTLHGAPPVNEDYQTMKETTNQSNNGVIKVSLTDLPIPSAKQTTTQSNTNQTNTHSLKHTITLTDGGIRKSSESYSKDVTDQPINQSTKQEIRDTLVQSDASPKKQSNGRSNGQANNQTFNQRVVHPPITLADDQENQIALKHFTNTTSTKSTTPSNNQLNRQGSQNDVNPLSPGTSAKILKKEQEKESSSRTVNQDDSTNQVRAHYESGQEPGDQAISDPINQDLWPDSPTAEPLTKLRALPLPNRLFNKLPHFISRGGSGTQASNEYQSAFIAKFINGLAPATAGTEMANFSDNQAAVQQAIVANGELARNDQTLVERVQQERMKQERMAALSNSQDLAQGSSDLLKNVDPSQQERKPATTNRSLSVQQAALASAIHHHRYGAYALKQKAKVTFNALVDRLPRRATKAFHRTKKSRSVSYGDGQSMQPSSIPSPGQAIKRHQAKHMPMSPASFAKRIWRTTVDFIRESIFLTHLALLLIAQMGLFGRWIWMTVRLLVFAVFLIQAWVKIGYTVLFCHRIERSIQYGPYNRNFLDIYLPTRIKGSILRPIENNQYQRETIPNATTGVATHGDASLAVKHPVMVYVTGGAWIIGYKAWGALIGLVLRAQGYVVVSVDYRNFPQGNIEDMVIDVEQSLRWVYDNIEDFGGDKSQIYLSGQSAGGQITSLLLLRNAKREAEGAFDEELEEEANGASLSHLIKAHAAVAEAAALADHAQKRVERDDEATDSDTDGEESDSESAAPPKAAMLSNRKRPSAIDRTTTEEESDSDDSEHSIDSPGASPTALMAVKSALRTGFPVSRIKGWVGISGVYAMSNRILNHLHASGLPGGVTSAIMGGPNHLAAVDPTRLIQQPEFCNPRVASLFPPVLIIAGSGDSSVPLSIPREYATALARAGIPVTFRCYIGATHTDPIIEHPLRGCHHLTYDVKNFLERCLSGEAQLGRNLEQLKIVRDDELGMERCEPIKINRLASLPFEKNGERMVNGLSVRCAAFFNPF